MGLVIDGKGKVGPTTLQLNPKPKVKAGSWECDREYCFAQDGKTVVTGDDPRARFVLFPKGEIIKVEVKNKYGLPLKAQKVKALPKTATPPAAPRRGLYEPGKTQPEENKAVTPENPVVETK